MLCVSTCMCSSWEVRTTYSVTEGEEGEEGALKVSGPWGPPPKGVCVTVCEKVPGALVHSCAHISPWSYLKH